MVKISENDPGWKCLSSVNHTTRTTHHHHHNHHHHHHHHHHHVKDNHNRYLQADNCAKECQLNQVNPREIKDNSLKLYKLYKLNKLSKRPTVKTRSIATFLFTILRSRADSAYEQILSNCHYTKRGALIREGLSNLV